MQWHFWTYFWTNAANKTLATHRTRESLCSDGITWQVYIHFSDDVAHSPASLEDHNHLSLLACLVGLSLPFVPPHLSLPTCPSPPTIRDMGVCYTYHNYNGTNFVSFGAFDSFFPFYSLQALKTNIHTVYHRVSLIGPHLFSSLSPLSLSSHATSTSLEEENNVQIDNTLHANHSVHTVTPPCPGFPSNPWIPRSPCNKVNTTPLPIPSAHHFTWSPRLPFGPANPLMPFIPCVKVQSLVTSAYFQAHRSLQLSPIKTQRHCDGVWEEYY